MCDDLLAIAINGAEDHGALHLPRDLDCQCERLARVVKREGLFIATNGQRVIPGASSWVVSRTRLLTKRTDHGEAHYSTEACINQAESYFNRLRRSATETHHHFAGCCLSCYATDVARRENNCGVLSGGQYLKVTEAALNAPISRM